MEQNPLPTQDFDHLINSKTPAVIAVIGAGSWGTALAALLANCGHDIRLWARDANLVAAIRDGSMNEQYLPGIYLPGAILPTADMEQAVSAAQALVFAIPSGGIRDVAGRVAEFIETDALIISASKGLEDGTG